VACAFTNKRKIQISVKRKKFGNDGGIEKEMRLKLELDYMEI